MRADWPVWHTRLGSGTNNTLACFHSSQVAVDQPRTDGKGLSTLTEAKPPGFCPVKSLSSLFMLFNVAISLLNAYSCFCLLPTHPLATRLLSILLCTRDVLLNGLYQNILMLHHRPSSLNVTSTFFHIQQD